MQVTPLHESAMSNPNCDRRLAYPMTLEMMCGEWELLDRGGTSGVLGNPVGCFFLVKNSISISFVYMDRTS